MCKSETPRHTDIRRATHDDAGDIAQLVTALGYPTTTEQMHTRLEIMGSDNRCAAFVALVDGRTVGMIAVLIQPIVEQDEPIGRIIALSVCHDYQGSGIGKSLAEAAERWIRLRGASAILVNSGNDRDDAHRFYENIGYLPKGKSFRKKL